MSSALHLLGEPPVSVSPAGLAIARKGFRPFFLLAGAFAASTIPMWLLSLAGIFRPTATFDLTSLHAHEMLFGFAVAVTAGFLLTAVANWTGRETLVGRPLLLLAALWIAGRVAMVLPQFLPKYVPAIVDCAFLPALALSIARPLVATGNRRNFVMIALLALLTGANVLGHLSALGVLPGWQARANRAGVDIFILLILIMSGRVFPMFTRNATGNESIRSVPTLDALSIAAMALLTLLDLTPVPSGAIACAATLASLFAALRTVHWGARNSFRLPLVWVLHLGYAWIPLGLAMRALSWLGVASTFSVSTHALTVGAIGGITLGMMSRVSLGHSGRLLSPSRPVVVAFVCVTLAAFVRVFVPWIRAGWAPGAFHAAGTLWSLAFLLFTWAYLPILVKPRSDGKPG